MRYKPKSMAALQLALGGLPDRMRVEVDLDVKFDAGCLIRDVFIFRTTVKSCFRKIFLRVFISSRQVCSQHY